MRALLNPPVPQNIKRNDWTGDSVKGVLYTNGTASAALNMPSGACVITIEAKGSRAGGVWPYMVVELDGSEIGETFVDTDIFRKYTFYIESEKGVKVLSATFINDGYDKTTKEDRNLFLDNAWVEKRP